MPIGGGIKRRFRHTFVDNLNWGQAEQAFRRTDGYWLKGRQDGE